MSQLIIFLILLPVFSDRRKSRYVFIIIIISSTIFFIQGIYFRLFKKFNDEVQDIRLKNGILQDLKMLSNNVNGQISNNIKINDEDN